MLRKQLITLAAILGILGCGACFLPGSETPAPAPPPPPPLHVDLYGIRSIGVSVANDSEGKHVEPGALAQGLRIAIDSYYSNTGVRGYVSQESNARDATLRVAVLEETAEPVPNTTNLGGSRWRVRFRVTATLTSRSGRVVWRETEREQDLSPLMHATDEASFWQKDPLPWLTDRLATLVVQQMLFEDTHD